MKIWIAAALLALPSAAHAQAPAIPAAIYTDPAPGIGVLFEIGIYIRNVGETEAGNPPQASCRGEIVFSRGERSTYGQFGTGRRRGANIVTAVLWNLALNQISIRSSAQDD